MKLLLNFITVWAMVIVGWSIFTKLTTKEKLDFTKILLKSAVTAGITVAILTLIVILF